ncbi:MAG: hypothetical protein CMH83_04885 [Nocardioides sp.]|nr:hypothetical protein [Nocardioides sp.]
MTGRRTTSAQPPAQTPTSGIPTPTAGSSAPRSSTVLTGRDRDDAPAPAESRTATPRADDHDGDDHDAGPSQERSALLTRLGGWHDRVATSRGPLLAWAVLVLAGTAAMVCAMLPVGPTWLGETGAVVVAAAYSWALAARTGGRPVVFGTLAALIGVAALVLDTSALRTGAAVMTCVVGAVLAVMATVPAVTAWRALRECVIACLVAVPASLAVVGLEPELQVQRFEYVTLGLSLLMVFGVVYRLGAGFHGLGRRGVVVVLVGGALLAASLTYAELLRSYGSPGLVESLLDGVLWSRTELGAFPRPIMAVLGVPALAYGCHMRARRRQGWWVTAFGAAATAAVGNALANPLVTTREAGLSVLMGLVVGGLLGWLVIRADLLVTGGGPTKGRGRRSNRRAEEAEARRPEPGRFAALL